MTVCASSGIRDAYGIAVAYKVRRSVVGSYAVGTFRKNFSSPEKNRLTISSGSGIKETRKAH